MMLYSQLMTLVVTMVTLDYEGKFCLEWSEFRLIFATFPQTILFGLITVRTEFTETTFSVSVLNRILNPSLKLPIQIPSSSNQNRNCQFWNYRFRFSSHKKKIKKIIIFFKNWLRTKVNLRPILNQIKLEIEKHLEFYDFDPYSSNS